MDFTSVFNDCTIPPPILRVDTFDDAVRLVAEMQRCGADIFRGQNQTFPPRPSLQRIQEPSPFETARAATIDFMKWLTNRLVVAGEPPADDDPLAVAQHYSFKTTLLDVTLSTDVAFFFAHDQARAGEDVSLLVTSRGRIAGAARVAQDMDWPDTRVDLVEVRIPSLWRIHSQKGAFIYCAVGDMFDALFARVIYRFDPAHTVSVAERTFIYPDRRSDLELAIEQYRDVTLSAQEVREGKSLFERLKIPTLRFRRDPLAELRRTFGVELEPHNSWPPRPRGLQSRPEQFDEIVELEVDGPLASFTEDGRLLPGASLNWIITTHYPHASSLVGDDPLIALVNHYLDVAVATGIERDTLIEGIKTLLQLEHDRRGMHRIAWERCVKVEFASVFGGYNRVALPRGRISSCLRPDFTTIVSRETMARMLTAFQPDPGLSELDAIEEMLLFLIPVPQCLFDYGPFNHLFDWMILPHQIFRQHFDVRREVIVTADQLKSFGLP